MRALALSFLVAAGCGARKGVPPPEPAPAAMDTTDAGIVFADEADYFSQSEQAAHALDRLVAESPASAVASCRVVPTSEQGCGGPTSFAVFSVEDPDAHEIERLAGHLVALDRAANAQFAYVSTCMAYDPPVPVLREGRCVAGP